MAVLNVPPQRLPATQPRSQAIFSQLNAGSKKGPGTYCMGDSAHAPPITQNLGNRTTNVKRP